MAEIRIREKDATPALIKALELAATDLKEATLTGTLIKLVPRYFDMKKRIEECNKEIGELSQQVRTMEYRKSQMDRDFETHIDGLKDYLFQVERSAKQLGTKNSKRQPARKKPTAKKSLKKSPVKKKGK